MKAIHSSKTSVPTITSRQQIPEDDFIHRHHRENLKSYIMLTLFWDMNGQILKRYQEKGEKVNRVRYNAMLEEKLKSAICSHCHELLSKGVLLLHDNTQPHIAAATVTTTQKLKFETINHPTYRLDLAPSDYHVFGMLKKALRG
jgi:RNase P subunit RPR2